MFVSTDGHVSFHTAGPSGPSTIERSNVLAAGRFAWPVGAASIDVSGDSAEEGEAARLIRMNVRHFAAAGAGRTGYGAADERR